MIAEATGFTLSKVLALNGKLMKIDKEELKELLFEKILRSGRIESYRSPSVSIIYYFHPKKLDEKEYDFSIRLLKRELFLTTCDLMDIEVTH